MTIQELQWTKTALKMEVDLYLHQRGYDPIICLFDDFCWKIAKHYRPSNTNAVFEADMAEFALKYGMEVIDREKCF